MNILNKIVKNILAKHEGGEAFFDALDSEVRNNTVIVQTLLDNIPKDKRTRIVCSGNFGWMLSKYLNLKKRSKEDTCGAEDFKIIITTIGGLRKGNTLDLSSSKRLINGFNYIFIDDSFYSGKTRDVIKEEIEKQGGKLIDTYVVYDGSHCKEENVHSLYRYHN